MNCELTHSQQTARVGFLGVVFMIMFTAFNSLQNIVSKIYNDYGYTNLGEVSILLLYFTFGVTTLFTPFLIRKIGYKKVLFISSLGYAAYEAVGLIIAMAQGLPRQLGWVIVLIGAILCGASASMIWVAQGSYVSEVAGEARKTELFGLFWSLMMSSQIVGNLITTFVLGLVSNVVYFIVLTILGVLSAFLFLLLPDVQGQAQGEQEVRIGDEVKKMTSILKDSKYKNLFLYYFFPGVAVGFYATFIYKLVGLSIEQNDHQSDSDYNKRVSFRSGLVFIALGLSQALTGLVMNRIGERFCKFKEAIFGTLMVEVAGFVSLLCFFLKSYPLCFAVAFLWGSAETFLQTNIGALTGLIFPGKVEAFSVYRVIFALGTTITIILNVLLRHQPAWIFLTIVMTLQIFISTISIQLRDLQKKSPQSQSLIDEQS